MIKIRGLRWWMISLIMLGSVVNYLTRSTLAVAAPTVLQELHIGAREYSWIVGAFQGAIMAQPVCGICFQGACSELIENGQPSPGWIHPDFR